ncbi:uncharacterized protein LOC130645977 [Hydractinia symbiolongicarpus]|uniref:uncharacterized protein LOC130645977 n=1 Tax=Hydractinia symbiolongicarpus TaxID=13093 RepID=UPI00254F993D|nr:uncharacterized protein LOC130645977 [Hydractinia symbiolongicarpus]
MATSNVTPKEKEILDMLYETVMKPYVDLYNWEGIEFPTSTKSIYKFEANNPDIAVNVLYIEGKKINILRRSVRNGRSKLVTLLLIKDDKKTHYTAVKSLWRFLGKETPKNRNAMHFCLNCLQGFPTIEWRDKHYRYCENHEAVKITMPTEAEKWLYYRNGQQQLKVPFAIYADFESLLVPLEDARGKKSKKLSKHVPSGWCTYSTFAYGHVPDPLMVYRGEDCVTRFVNHLEDEVKRLYNTYLKRDMLPLTEVLKREHDEATHCHICLKPFDDWYDAHLFIRELGEKYDTQDIGSIAENVEKYINFNVKIKVPLVASSLNKLASNLIGTNAAGMKFKQCANTCPEFQGIDAEYMSKFWFKNCDSNTTKQLNRDQVNANVPSMAKFIDKYDTFRLMLRKDVYPYEYMNGWQRFEESELPPKEAFYSKLNMKGISDNDHEYAKKVWNVITPEGDNVTMGDYHDIYLTIDVLLLADVFETFRDVCVTNYKVDPAHFYSAPGLAWKAALKFTGIRLELLTDPDMLLMFEKGIRGGITQAVHRYARSNNKYMGDLYDSEVKSSYLQYLDANNLYGWAMRQDLPTDGFKWVSNVEAFTERRIEKLVRDNKHGYILEVEIDYPERLDDKHNKPPFLPSARWFIGALHEAIKHGLELKKVRRVIRFNQKAWLKGYIDHNTRLRTDAKNEFEKDFYKLMNLNVFGKTMENPAGYQRGQAYETRHEAKFQGWKQVQRASSRR